MKSVYKKELNAFIGNQKALTKALNTRSRSKVFDKLIHIAHSQAFDEVECLECANCCKTTGPLLTPNDIKNISSKLRCNEKDFSTKYLSKDDDGDMIFSSMPCPFLNEDNSCAIYAFRPRACRKFPHTDEKGQAGILHLTRKNAKVCPAVSKIVQIVASL